MIRKQARTRTAARNPAGSVPRSRENEYRTMIENSSDAVVRLDRRLRFLYTNPAVQTITGIAPEELLGKLFLKVIKLAANRRLVRRAADQVFRTKREKGIEIEFQVPAGRRCFEIRLIPEGSGRAATLLAIARDVTRYKQAEEALRESEERYRSLFRLAKIEMLLLDPKTLEIVDANPAACRCYGYPDGGLTGKKMYEVRVEMDPGATAKMREALAGRRQEFSCTQRLHGGEERRVEVTVTRTRVSGRPLLHLLVHDVTGHWKAERQITESLRHLSFLSASAMRFVEKSYGSDIFAFIGEQVRGLAGNATVVVSEFDALRRQTVLRAVIAGTADFATAARYFGRSPLGMTVDLVDEQLPFLETGRLLPVEGGLSTLISKEVPRAALEELERVAGIRRVYAISFTIQDDVLGTVLIMARSGEPLPHVPLIEAFVHQAAVALKGWRTGQALRRAHDELELTVCRRTAELTASNAQLNRSNELLEKLFANTALLIAYMDTRFNFIRVNQAYAQREGRKSASFVGQNHFTLYPNAENERIFRGVVETGRPYAVFAKPFVYRNAPERGVTFWDWSLQPVKDAAGAVEGLILCLVDVTQRTLAEAELLRMQKELNDAKRLLDIGVLSATIAHEIRNPLAAIRTAAYNIERKAGGPLLESHLATINKKVVESDQIIQNLLSYSRIKMPDYASVGIRSLLEECIETMTAKYSRWQVTVEQGLDLRDGDSIEADPVHLKMLFLNILDNAFQALSERTGTVRVSSRCRGRLLETVIADSGIGINPGDRDRIFDPFFTRRSRGVGLGLSICRQIVSLHDGSISVESSPGKGTSLTVLLPLRRKSRRGSKRSVPAS